MGRIIFYLFSFIFLLSFNGIINSQFILRDITPPNLLVSYPAYLTSTNCIIYHYILISNTTQKENIDQLVPTGQFISSGYDSIIYSYTEIVNIGETKNVIFTVNDNNQTNGFLNVSFICKDVDVSLVTIDIIQEITWSENLKYSSIVRLNGVPDEIASPESDSAVINPLGNSKFRIIYKESYFTKLPSFNSIQWDIQLKFTSNQVLNVSVPFTPNQGLHTVVSGIEEYGKDKAFLNDAFAGAILFRSNSTIQRPIYTVFTVMDPYYETPRPIYGEKGNITYYLNIFPNFPINQTYSLYSQNDDGSFGIILNKTVQYTMDNTKNYGPASVQIDNTTIESTLFFNINFNGIESYDDRIFTCDYKGMFYNRFLYGFPFGFINGNNKNNTMGISTPIPSLSVTQNNILSCDTLRVQIQNPLYNPDFEGNATSGKVSSYEKINLYGFTFIVVFNAEDDYGFNYFKSNIVQRNIGIGNEGLVFGNIYNGVWEFLHDGVNVGSDQNSNGFTLSNQIDKNKNYKPEFPFSNTNPDETISFPEIKLN
ncbi:hypothetical protein ACTFIU_001954, partial [Dictyostelium citrinum]